MSTFKELKVLGYYKSYSQIEYATLAAKQKCVDTYLDLHFLGTSDTQINPNDNSFTFISQIKYDRSSFDSIRETFEDSLVRNGCRLMIQRYRSSDIASKVKIDDIQKINTSIEEIMKRTQKWWQFWK